MRYIHGYLLLPCGCVRVDEWGADEIGITKGEAENAVAEASIPFYNMVTVLRDASEEEAIDNAKLRSWTVL